MDYQSYTVECTPIQTSKTFLAWSLFMPAGIALVLLLSIPLLHDLDRKGILAIVYYLVGSFFLSSLLFGLPFLIQHERRFKYSKLAVAGNEVTFLNTLSNKSTHFAMQDIQQAFLYFTVWGGRTILVLEVAGDRQIVLSTSMVNYSRLRRQVGKSTAIKFITWRRVLDSRFDDKF